MDMTPKILCLYALTAALLRPCHAAGDTPPVIWLEAEQFAHTGTWSVDAQFVDIMGSVQLLATGCGKPV